MVALNIAAKLMDPLFTDETPDQQLQRLIRQYSQPATPAGATATPPPPPPAPIAVPGGPAAVTPLIPPNAGMKPSGPNLPPPTAEIPPPDVNGPPPVMPSPSNTTRSPVNPVSPEGRQAADQEELQRLESTGSGVSQLRQKHPILGTIATIGDVALGSMFPRVASLVPGTTVHHNALVGQAEGRLAGDIGQEKAEAANKEAAARTNLLNEQASVAANPKEGLTAEDQAFSQLIGSVNPKTGKPYTALEAFQEVNNAKQLAAPGNRPVGDASAKQYNDSILRELNVNPKTAQKAIPPEYQVMPTDTDAEAKEKLSRAKDLVGGATGQQKIEVSTGNQGNARSDRSYALQSKRLDDTRKPVEQIQQRIGRLNDTLAQRNPQADALVAPELLSIMSGGQGSGLRMNEAEISRIVGGRSVWENLKAKIQHWSTNPEDARSITPDQDKQIRGLVKMVQDKLTAKQKILDDADEALLGSDDVKQHRAIVSDAKKKLDAIDAGTVEQAGAGGASGKEVSLAAAKQLPQNKGKSDDEIRKDIEAHGHKVVD